MIGIARELTGISDLESSYTLATDGLDAYSGVWGEGTE